MLADHFQQDGIRALRMNLDDRAPLRPPAGSYQWIGSDFPPGDVFRQIRQQHPRASIDDCASLAQIKTVQHRAGWMWTRKRLRRPDRNRAVRALLRSLAPSI